MYIVSSSWIVSNYAIRTDNEIDSSGKYPLWNTELFRRSPEREEARYSHILDFDVLRLGKKVIENNKNAGSFEFGVVNISEVGKERKNNLELTGTKKDEDFANQKNDYFNLMLKMIRHPGCVNKYCYVKVFTDEQRPESLGADARDLFNVVEIKTSSELGLVMPGFLFGDLLHDLLFDRCRRFYYTYCADTLFMYIFKNIFAALNRHYVRTYNRFGRIELELLVKAGSLDSSEPLMKYTYKLSTKKDYSNRFSTDCYSGFFKPMAQKAKTGLFLYPEYDSSCASKDELDLQHSYFISELDSRVFKPGV